MSTDELIVKFKRASDQAVIPTKAHHNDIGFDLTLIKVESGTYFGVNGTLYDTGIIVQPPEGYYIEIVPRSSFSKFGHMMLNSVGIIDPQYRGTLKVAVVHHDQTFPKLQLPFKGFQMILRKANVYSMEEVSELSQTERGEGGFGSSNKQ